METTGAKDKESHVPHTDLSNLTAEKFADPANHAPDPDEDDLDDLDDLLDEFSSTKIEPTKAALPPAAPKPNELPDELEVSDVGTEDFSRQLQEQMAALLGTAEETPQMKKEIEGMMRELGAAADSVSMASSKSRPDGGSLPSATSTGGEDAFQETIRKTMERMQQSGEQAAAAANEDPNDIMAQMLKEMQSGDLQGAHGEEDFSKMLLSMMEQLTNKDILYEPMKELHEKYPAWISKNRDKTKREDLKRYEEQQELVVEIVAKFEEKGYSDSKAADREYIVERMQKMQAAGSPPADLVGDMNGAQEALGNLDAGCPQQ